MSTSVDARPPVLVVIAGPQASGKSTVSSALAAERRRLGELVALVALDAIAEMALPTLPDWGTAYAIFESVVRRWARAGLDCVIAEGSGTAAEVARLLSVAPADCARVTVACTADFEVALERARADPSRVLSRDRDFLGGVYERWPAEVRGIDPDVLLRTSDLSVPQCVDAVGDAIDAARISAGSR